MESCCPICQESGKEGAIITCEKCKHEFHKACVILWIEKGNGTSCPCCRTSLEKFGISEEVLKGAEQRRRDEAEEENAEAALMFDLMDQNRRNTDYVQMFSDSHYQSLVLMFSMMPIREIVAMSCQELINHFHDPLHNGSLNRYTCVAVDRLISDVFVFCHNDQEILDVNSQEFRDVVTWFCEMIPVQPSDMLHMPSHNAFPDISCAHLSQYCRTAICILMGVELLMGIFRDEGFIEL